MKMQTVRQMRVLQGRLRLAILLGILFGLLALASAVAEASDDTRLVFLGNKNIAPVVYLDNGTPAGVVVDIVHALAKHIPQPVEIRAMDWAEAQALVARGDADALIQINETEERRKIYDFSDTLLESQFSIFVSENRVGISGISSLQGLRVGVEAGGLPRQVLEKNPRIPLTIIPNFLEGFKLLNAGAIDAVVVDYRVGSYVIAENKLRNIRIAGDPIAFSYSSIAVKKGNTKLLAAINHALQTIKSDGTYQKILDKWKPTEVVFQTREQIRQKIYYVTTGILLVLFLISILWTLTLRNQLKRRKAAEEKLTASLYARSLIEASLDPLVTISVEGKITDVNEATVKATGVTRETLIGSDFFNYFTEPDKARAGYQEVFAKGFVTDYPLALRHASGSVMEVLYNASVYRNATGEVAGVFAAARDVTRARRAEKLVRERVKELQAFFHLSELAARKDFPLDSLCQELANVLPGSWQYPETACARIVMGESEFRTANFGISEWMQAAPVKVFGAVVGKVEVGYLEQRPEEDEGPFLKEERKLIEAIAERVGQIAELKRAEEAIRISQARFSTIFNQAPLGIALIDSFTGRIYEVNPRFAEIAGRTVEEMMTIDWMSITHPDDVQADLDNMVLLNAGKIPGFNMDKRYIRPDGSFVWINMTIAPLRVEQNISPRHLCMIDDITERKRAEEALKQALAELGELNETLEQRVDQAVRKNLEQERMLVHQSRQAAMGEMIGNIAHQWRQPLNALNMVLANIKDAYAFNELTAEEMDRCVTKGRSLTQKMSDTIDDFRNFFRPSKKTVPFSLRRSVEESLALLDASLKSNNIEVVVDCEAEVMAYGFPNEYSQVLVNVLNNAKDVIVARKIARGEIHVRIAREGGSAVMTIRDNGGGIPEDVLPRVFEAYFTTKEEGTGIGLYMSKLIIENNMGGQLLARNVAGGAEFIVVCPLAPETDNTTAN